MDGHPTSMYGGEMCVHPIRWAPFIQTMAVIVFCSLANRLGRFAVKSVMVNGDSHGAKSEPTWRILR